MIHKLHRKNTPVIYQAMAVALLANFLPFVLGNIISFNLSYIGWIVPLLVCGFYVLPRLNAVRFPLVCWWPWVLMVLLYLLMAEADNSFQRAIMLFTPLVVGAAFSTLSVNDSLIDLSVRWMGRFIWIFLIGAGVSSGLLLRGELNEWSGSAAGAITASLLAAWVAVRVAQLGVQRHLLIWGLLAFVPVAYMTRMGMIAVALTLPLTFTRWPMRNRLLIVGVLALAGLAVFSTERVQSKMFFSGQGTIEQAWESALASLKGEDTGSADFRTNARKAMNAALISGLDEAFWFGHGSNTTEEIAYRITEVTHPHNDWLRLWYEYGLVGLLLFAFAMIAQSWHSWRSSLLLEGDAARFMLAGAASFVPMAMFMFTDNVILYAAWFGNLQFAMLGLGYAALHQKRLGVFA